MAPTPASATTPSYASLHENGTGPFTIESHQPGVKTVFKAYPNWWGKPEHNLKEIDLHPDRLRRDARRGAAVGRSRRHRAGSDPGHRARQRQRHCHGLNGPELRTIFLGMDQSARRAALFERQGQESVQGHPRPRGLLQGDRRRPDQEPRDARAVDAVGADGRAAAVPAVEGFHATEIRSRRRQEAADRSRLCGRLRSHDGLPERSLRQRRRDLPGGGRHAGPDRRQGRPAGAAEGSSISPRCSKPGGYKTSFFLLGWTPASHRLPQRAARHHGLPRRSEGPHARRSQSRRLLQQGPRCARPTRCWSRPTRPSAIS